jgi:hypothetical protein
VEEKVEEHPKETPRCIVETAYQPTARGGQIHYVTGNIRFVSMARNLLDEAYRAEMLTTMDAALLITIGVGWEVQETVWRSYMEVEHGISPEKKMTEQLLVQEQVLYACPQCGPSFLL